MVMRIDRKQRDGRFVPFLELHVAPDEYHRDIGAQKRMLRSTKLAWPPG